MEFEAGANLVAFCVQCSVVVFKGNDRTAVEKRVLKERVIDHLKYFEDEHDILVFFPNRESEQFIDAESYLETGISITMQEAFPRIVPKMIRGV